MSGKNTCSCEFYKPLELSREIISRRIKDSKKIIKYLSLEVKSKKGGYLYKCKFCNQFWQLNCAWNWGGKDYLFKVPYVEIDSWIENPFISPAEMMIFSATMKSYSEKHQLIDSNNDCKRENCNKKAILKDVLCKFHFIESLQKFNLLPEFPKGKIFEPYNFDFN